MDVDSAGLTDAEKAGAEPGTPRQPMRPRIAAAQVGSAFAANGASPGVIATNSRRAEALDSATRAELVACCRRVLVALSALPGVGTERGDPVATLGDDYLTLEELSAYSKVSIRQLRKWIALPPGQALPRYAYGRNRLVVRRSEFDTWFAQYRLRGKAIVVRVLRDLGLDPERPADRRVGHAISRTGHG